MIQRHNLEAVDRTLRDLCRSRFPFRGILVLLIADLWQFLPVVRTENRSHIVSTCFKRSRVFPLLPSLHLHTNVRLLALQNYPHAASEAFPFQSYLLRLGEGMLQQNEKNKAIVSTSLQQFREQFSMVQHVFPNIEDDYQNVTLLAEKAIFTTKNVCLKDLNNLIAFRIPSSGREL